jgi:formate hydrogenlyase subunit 3/multisubunit Na+/H+ antiporter MnhD subunit
MSQVTRLGCSSTMLRLLVALGLIVVGVVHQFLMYFFRVERIYVFVNPPGYISPFVSLEYQWWFVLLLGSVVMCVMAYSDRLKNIPTRLAYPFYFYILFLLIFVKPV